MRGTFCKHFYDYTIPCLVFPTDDVFICCIARSYRKLNLSFNFVGFVSPTRHDLHFLSAFLTPYLNV